MKRVAVFLLIWHLRQRWIGHVYSYALPFSMTTLRRLYAERHEMKMRIRELEAAR